MVSVDYCLFFDIQVQHTHMTDTAAADYASVELIVNTLHRFFPSFDYRYTDASLPLICFVLSVIRDRHTSDYSNNA